MAKVSIKGTVEKIGEVQTVGQKGYQKREVWVREEGGNERYPSIVPIVCDRDNLDAFVDCKEGDSIGADCWLNGREYNGRCYVDIKLAKLVEIKKAGGNDSATDEPMGPEDNEPMPF